MHMPRKRGGLARGLTGAALGILALAGAACSSTPATSTTTTTSTTSAAAAAVAATSTTSTTSATSVVPTTPASGPPGGVVPADFKPSSFTAVSLDEWWMIGTAQCLVGTGTCGAIVRTTDGGAHFSGIPSPPVGASDVTQVRFANALDGYAFGPELWETTNGGTSWAQVATGEVTDLEAADGEAYALTCAVASCQSMALLRSPVGSDAWQHVSTPDPLLYGATFTLSGANLYVFSGETGAGHAHTVLAYSGDRGATFSRRVDPCTPDLGGSATTTADGSSALWAACPTGTEAEALLSSNGGTTWRAVGRRFDNALHFTAASSSVALAWPGQEFSGEAPAALDRTTNGGETYSAVVSSAWRVQWAGYSDPTRAYAILAPDNTGPTAATRLFESNDGGATWHEVAIKS
jgi:hypothetical protein